MSRPRVDVCESFHFFEAQNWFNLRNTVNLRKQQSYLFSIWPACPAVRPTTSWPSTLVSRSSRKVGGKYVQIYGILQIKCIVRTNNFSENKETIPHYECLFLQSSHLVIFSQCYPPNKLETLREKIFDRDTPPPLLYASRSWQLDAVELFYCFFRAQLYFQHFFMLFCF